MFYNHFKMLFGQSKYLMISLISLLLFNRHYEADLVGCMALPVSPCHDITPNWMGKAFLPAYILCYLKSAKVDGSVDIVEYTFD